MKLDQHLRKDVEDELAGEPSVDAGAIGVAIQDGIVTLSGHAGSFAEKVAAERAAGRVEGVRAIVSELVVRLPGATRLSDEDIARAAIDGLAWNALVPKDRIRVQVGSGWVTLEGNVDWHYQKAAAHQTVSNLKGVTGVTDKIAILPSSVRNAVKAHIESALRRTYGRQPGHITVETRGDHVTLRGTVRSLWEREQVERAAWTTPGVCHVDNNLSVAGGSAAKSAG